VAETLAQAMPFSAVVDGGVLTARFGAGPMRAIAPDDRGASAGKKAVALSTDRVAAAAIPEIVTLAYNDVARDYLVGAQRAKRDAVARREVRLELPAALEAGAAKAIAEARLARMWAERSRATVTLPWRALAVAPGDRVTVPGLSGIWRVARVTFEAMVIRLDLILLSPASSVAQAADSGRNRPQVDLPHGPTSLHVIDLPQLGDTLESGPLLVVAANGASGGWRRASLMTSTDGGTTYADGGRTALPAVMGRTVTTLGFGAAALIDRINIVEVELIHPGLTLNDADQDALLAGANLAIIGKEVIQFGRATPLAAGRWQLSELWRGRRGLEGAIATHPIDSVFIMLAASALRRLDDASAVGGVKVMAVGVGDSAGVVVDGPESVGASVRPLSPVNLKESAQGADRLLQWTRRSRAGWPWRDLVDAPIGEESERYRVTKVASGRPNAVVDVDASSWTYAASERAADFAAGATHALISVVQIGALSLSQPAQIMISTS
jgi:Putative phage tail protein